MTTATISATATSIVMLLHCACLHAEPGAAGATASPTRKPLFFDGPPPPIAVQEALHRGDLPTAVQLLEHAHLADRENIYLVCPICVFRVCF